MKRKTLAIALLLAGGAAVGADLPVDPETQTYMTGVAPISHEEYDRLPKLGKFRAWLPKAVDLSNAYPKPGNQGQQPNCTAWATTYAARSFFNGVKLGRQPAAPTEQMSPAYLYNRLRPAGSACTGTVRIVDALNLLQNEGAVSLADFPYNDTNCPVPAPAVLRQKASDNRLSGWRAVDREVPGDWTTPIVLDDIKGALSRQEPVVFSMTVAPDFFGFRGPGIYTHKAPETGDRHAMAIVGYDEGRQAFRIINSWATGWGDHGYAWIDYDTFKMLTGEAYALEAPANGRPTVTAAVTNESFDALAAKLPCGSVKVTRSGGRLSVSGFAGGQDTLTELKYAAMSLDPKVNWNVTLSAWPQCEAQLTLAGPMSVGDGQMALMLQSDAGQPIGGDPIQLKGGDKFGILAETWPTRPYLSVFYIQADGSAVELYRGKPEPNAERRRAVNIGAGGAKAIRFQVAPPYGNEIIVAVASAQPLFTSKLDDYATERQFLTSLRAKLAATPSGSVSARVLRLRTKA